MPRCACGAVPGAACGIVPACACGAVPGTRASSMPDWLCGCVPGTEATDVPELIRGIVPASPCGAVPGRRAWVVPGCRACAVPGSGHGPCLRHPPHPSQQRAGGGGCRADALLSNWVDLQVSSKRHLACQGRSGTGGKNSSCATLSGSWSATINPPQRSLSPACQTGTAGAAEC